MSTTDCVLHTQCKHHHFVVVSENEPSSVKEGCGSGPGDDQIRTNKTINLFEFLLLWWINAGENLKGVFRIRGRIRIQPVTPDPSFFRAKYLNPAGSGSCTSKSATTKTFYIFPKYTREQSLSQFILTRKITRNIPDKSGEIR